MAILLCALVVAVQAERRGGARKMQAVNCTWDCFFECMRIIMSLFTWSECKQERAYGCEIAPVDITKRGYIREERTAVVDYS